MFRREKASSIMRALVVLPLVPVMATVFTSFASRPKSSGQTRRAKRPGMALPPRCRSLERRRRALQSKMDMIALKFMGVLL